MLKSPAKPKLGVILPVLVLASAASIMSTDLYTPSLPHLPAVFATSPSAVQLTVSLNLLAFALAQLFLGPLSDRFGRRPVMLSGLLLFVVFSLGCALAQSIGQLIVARVAQGIAASVEAVVGLAIVRDLFDESERVRALAIWGMSVALAPAAAPIIGGYVHVAFGWRANFILITITGLLACALLWRLLPESTTPDLDALHPVRLLRRYAALLLNRQFVGHGLILGASLGAIMAFITEGPFLLITHYGVATEHFGYYQGAIVAAFFLGSVSADRLASRITMDRLLRIGLGFAAAGAVSLPLLLATGQIGPTSLTIAMSVLGFGLGPIFAVAPLRALDAAPARIGTASALLGVFEMGIGGLASLAVTILHDGTTAPLVLTVVGLLVVAIVAWRLARQNQ